MDATERRIASNWIAWWHRWTSVARKSSSGVQLFAKGTFECQMFWTPMHSLAIEAFRMGGYAQDWLDAHAFAASSVQLL